MRQALPIALALLVGSTPLNAQTAGGSPAEVVQAFHAALQAGDSAAALALLDRGVVVYESGGVESSRAEYRSHHLAADMRFSKAVERRMTDQTSGTSGDIAWVLTESRTTGTYQERSIDIVGTETMLLRRGPDGWRIVHIHWSSARAGGD